MIKARAFFACLLLALSAGSELHAVQRVEQQSWPVQPGCLVKIDTYRGLVNVVPGTDNAVRLVVRVNMESAKVQEAREMLDGFQVKADVQRNEVRITARNPRDGGVRFTWDQSLRPEIEFTLEVPPHCNLDLLTKDGGITVGNLRGDMKARTEIGTIFFRQIEGNVDAYTPSGDVVVSRCTGAVTLRAIQGNVRIGTVGGRARLETVNGDIEVLSAYAAVSAVTAAGDVNAGFAGVGGESKIQTSVGNIIAKVNPALGFSIHAASLWGKVTSKFALAGYDNQKARGQLTGQYNGGGPLIDLKANGGHVTIEPGEPLFPL